jgi:hypothetical protein
MRARHRSPELIGAEREAFELSTAEIARIRLNASASD